MREGVIATIPFDLILSFAVGLAVAWTARVQLRLGGRAERLRQLLTVVSFQGLIFAPIGVYLYAVHPDWSWNYFIDPAAIPAWLGWAAVSCYFFVGIGGFFAGVALVDRGRETLLLQLVLGVCGLLGLFFVIFLQRFWWVGTFAQWHSGPAEAGMQPLLGARLGWVLGGVIPLFSGVLGYYLYRAVRHGQRLRRAPLEAVPEPEKH